MSDDGASERTDRIASESGDSDGGDRDQNRGGHSTQGADANDGDVDESDPQDEFGLSARSVTGDSDRNDAHGSAERATATDRDGPATDGVDGDAPLSSLASSLDERRDRRTERDDELFDEEAVTEIDTDVVWERLDETEPTGTPDGASSDVRVIEKRQYCEQCPHFSTPPDVECGHDGTEILELVDMEQFRVVDCPKVEADERLERL